MTEAEAQDWILATHGETDLHKLKLITDLVGGESEQQNLIAPSTIKTIWTRHIVDSAQLLNLVLPSSADHWVDIGSGAGFPGLVIASLSNCSVTLVEPRKRRAAFLTDAIRTLKLANAEVLCCRMGDVDTNASVISARAVAPLSTLLEWSYACASPRTRWVFPKGRSAREEVATAQQAWHGVFHVEHSITDPESMIVVASGVARR